MHGGRAGTTRASALQQPVRSSRGGYLRCPFSIQAPFVEMAERHAGGDFNGSKAHAVHSDDNDNDENFRPWSRAGVGAKQLSAKERRAQQQEAERIYGAVAADDADVGADTATSMPVALAPWEKSALHRVVPRAVVRSKGKRDNTETVQQRPQQVGPSSAGHKRGCEGRAPGEGAERQRQKPEDDGRRGVHPRDATEAGGAREAEEHQQRFLGGEMRSNLRRLDEMRNAALFGKKKKKTPKQ